MATLPAVGDKAPDFELPRDGGGSVSLADFRGRKLVLYFYPKDDTPACTEEAIAFNRLRAAFRKAGAELLGVSADSPKKHDRFKKKHDLSLPLASDETTEMLQRYGLWVEKSMYGRTFMGIARTTILIGPDGRVVRIWEKVKVEGHAEEVLEAVTAG
ncbi:peroxiredoxin [Terrarubrum flagellatum]|uniref:peroxiredoxin n=1 Tax=Terrirubrum flagellatum TaxID=2895980 RepID=UPI003145512F